VLGVTAQADEAHPRMITHAGISLFIVDASAQLVPFSPVPESTIGRYAE
jgi:hypothetical protein